ncbi:hypothetical protein L208DRAFT_1476727 [Tricholoma matsutake]|nr:hypothetical protein L208DRAFT_1476727 [Tricholoma matsutake 945]
MWNEHVRDSWEKEASEVWETVMNQTDEENKNTMAEWKKKASFTGSSEDLNQVQSNMLKGMTKKLLPQFDPEGWGKLQDMMLEYGKAYFCESDSDTSDSTGKEEEGVGNKCSLGGTTNNSLSGNASEFVDKPDDVANVQCLIGDSGTSQSIEKSFLSLGDNEQTTFLQEYMGDKCSLGGTTNNSSSGNASEFVDKPDDAANVQCLIRDSSTSQLIQVPSLSDAPMNEWTTFLQEYSCNAAPGESALYAFNPTSTLSSFGIQCNNQGFGNWSDVNWDTSQVANGWQVQGNVPSDSWFDCIISSLLNYGLQNANLTLEAPQPAFTFAQAVPQGPLVPMSVQGINPIGGINPPPSAPLAGTIVLQAAPASTPAQLPITPSGSINPPPSTPLLGTIILQVPPLLASSLAQECPQVPSKTTPLPTNLLLGLLDGKENEAVGDGGKGGGKSQAGNSGNKRGARKRKVDDALVGTKDGAASKLRRKCTSKTAGEEAMMATTEASKADRLAKEAKAAQDAAIKAAKAAKEAREVAKPEQARRSGRASTLPDHLKQAGYAPPKRGSRAKKSA